MENIIVITNNSNKKSILKKLSQNKEVLNLKFYTFLELKKKLFFDYNEESLSFIMEKYHVNLDIAKTYLDNLYFLQDLPDEKIIFLNKLKQELEQNNLLIKTPNFKDYLQNHRIIVYGYNYLSKEQLQILNTTGLKWELKQALKEIFTPKVYEAFNMKEELIFVLNKISSLIEKGIPLNKIKLIINKEYYAIAKRTFYLYNIPLNISLENTYFSTKIAQEFLANYDQYSLEENILRLSEKYTDLNDLITIINKSVLVLNKDIRKSFIIKDLKSHLVNQEKYENAVSVCDINTNFLDDEFVFLLGFNMNEYPLIKKDEDYLSDIVKEQLNLDTSTDLNKLNKETLKDFLTKVKNLVITYKKSNEGSICYPSILIEELNLDVEIVKIDKSLSYSKLNTKLDYALALDNKYKYNEIDPDLGLYQNSLTIPYRSYNNQFKGINKEAFINSLDNNLVLAYTNMEMYNECSFKYYLSKVLKIDIYEETFRTKIGSIVHHILELALIKDIDIPKEIMAFVKEKEYSLNSREFFYLEILSQELEEVIRILKKQASHSQLTKYLFEEELYTFLDRKGVNITFKGLIDKVMYQEFNGQEVLAVVDYKTGNIKLKLDNLEYGLNIQLPIYLYLLKKSERFKQALIGGFYIQKVLNNIPNIEEKSLTKIKEENLRLQGFSNSDERILALIDDNYLDSEVLMNLKFNRDGSLSKSSKVLSNKEMDELTKQVETQINDCVDHILEADFPINPKVVLKENVSCTYCKFKDICYKTKNDEVILGGEEVASN